jgi:hypothetical protein
LKRYTESVLCNTDYGFCRNDAWVIFEKEKSGKKILRGNLKIAESSKDL